MAEPAFPNGSGTYAGLTIRDYFAGQALQTLHGKLPPKDAAWRSYGYADAMLAQREKDKRFRDHEIEGLTRRAETAETTHEILRQENSELREAVKICLDAERERRKNLKPGAPATTYTDERIAVLERVLA